MEEVKHFLKEIFFSFFFLLPLSTLELLPHSISPHPSLFIIHESSHFTYRFSFFYSFLFCLTKLFSICFYSSSMNLSFKYLFFCLQLSIICVFLNAHPPSCFCWIKSPLKIAGETPGLCCLNGIVKLPLLTLPPEHWVHCFSKQRS